MQSWGTRSRFDERDTDLEPSKSGVIGLLCAALGVDRNEEDRVLQLARWRMGVRVDREGVLKVDYLTAQQEGDRNASISRRYYLADAVFLVGFEADDMGLLQQTHLALKNPAWPLGLGRKSYVPSPAVYLPDGLVALELEQALLQYPLLTEHKPDDSSQDAQKKRVRRFVVESAERVGSLRLDQPRSSFAKRQFAARYIQSFYGEVNHVSKPA